MKITLLYQGMSAIYIYHKSPLLLLCIIIIEIIISPQIRNFKYMHVHVYYLMQFFSPTGIFIYFLLFFGRVKLLFVNVTKSESLD